MAFSSSSLRGGRGRKLKSDINVVPYIDVMLVLLIIFMVVPPQNSPSVINLPNAQKSALPPDNYIQIQLLQNGELSLSVNGKRALAGESFKNRPALLRRLRALHSDFPEYPVMIAGDRDAKYDDVIQLISEAKKMGITRVGLATK
ncbi:ExbD/TolR family protein [Massilia sp. CF038]|uniref:ExbD/TolR family protein n=1 Tax=Massilia sp. CF038 TaxID=1881045 RepID=UPI0009219F07|nr:ExbD/TolR family protein [Massilia sp. CF038]SHH11572.1 Cell division and transport-associated protein TolR [Massilia sp. CF038]